MQHALDLARRAEQAGEVPIGAVIIKDEKILAEGWNQPISRHDPSAHAEMIALRKAGEAMGNYRLPNTTLYVTLEPCVMCLGAIMHARIGRLVFAALDPKAGALGGHFDLLQEGRFNHRINVQGGVLSEPCGRILREFFKSRRK